MGDKRKMGETGVKNTGEKGRNARNLSRVTQRRTSRMPRNASDAHVSSKISFIWHRGTIALLTRIAIVLLFLGNKKCRCEAWASQGKIIKISSHPAVYRGTRGPPYFTYRPRAVTHPRVCRLRKQMKYIEALLCLRRAEGFFYSRRS